MRTSAGLLVVLASVFCGLGAIAQEEIKPPNRRIVGGEPTDISRHRWQVALEAKGQFMCGGSIVAPQWILTAAHCFDEEPGPAGWRTKAGATNYVTSGIWLNIERVVIHDGYNKDTHEHDIAMIHLRTPPAGQVIPLAPAGLVVPVGQPLEVTGWGATSEGGPDSRQLLKATVPLVANTTCNEPESYNGDVKAEMLCAGRKEGGVDSCQGDSGGPLVWRRADGPTLVGVVAWGEGCAAKLKYGVYMRVTSYLDWIARVIASPPN
jgi:trypsin